MLIVMRFKFPPLATMKADAVQQTMATMGKVPLLVLTFNVVDSSECILHFGCMADVDPEATTTVRPSTIVQFTVACDMTISNMNFENLLCTIVVYTQQNEWMKP